MVPWYTGIQESGWKVTTDGNSEQKRLTREIAPPRRGRLFQECLEYYGLWLPMTQVTQPIMHWLLLKVIRSHIYRV